MIRRHENVRTTSVASLVLTALVLTTTVLAASAVPAAPPILGGARHDSRVVVQDGEPSWARSIGRIRVLQDRRERDGALRSWSTGTCTLVARDLVLTAWHIVASDGRRPLGAWTVELGYADGRCAAFRRGADIQAAVVAHDATEDWAVLRLDRRVPHIDPIPVAAAPAGDPPLTLAGYSGDDGLGAHGQRLTLDRACAGMLELARAGDGPLRRTRCFSYRGASGGPLIAETADGPVLAAIASRVFEDIPGWTFVSPAALFDDAVAAAR